MKSDSLEKYVRVRTMPDGNHIIFPLDDKKACVGLLLQMACVLHILDEGKDSEVEPLHEVLDLDFNAQFDRFKKDASS